MDAPRDRTRERPEQGPAIERTRKISCIHAARVEGHFGAAASNTLLFAAAYHGMFENRLMNASKLADYVGVPRSTMDLEELERSAESSEVPQGVLVRFRPGQLLSLKVHENFCRDLGRIALESNPQATGIEVLSLLKSEHTQLDCNPDPTLPALRASSASFVKIFLPAMRPDSQAPVI
jgi:hypothetical protein